jgi:deoxyribodipyrimidine photolyase
MTCEHLRQLEQGLVEAGVPITFRGQAWSSNCREWVYFACWLDRAAIRNRLKLADCVHDHDHRGTHNGQEAGFVCADCHDAIMGIHESARHTMPTFC